MTRASTDPVLPDKWMASDARVLGWPENTLYMVITAKTLWPSIPECFECLRFPSACVVDWDTWYIEIVTSPYFNNVTRQAERNALEIYASVIVEAQRRAGFEILA